MAYGLKVFSPDGNDTWFDSTTAFGFIEIDSFNVATDGTTNGSASGSLPGYTTIFPVYVPASIADEEGSPDTRRPVVASTFNAGTGAWTVTQTWDGNIGGSYRHPNGGVSEIRVAAVAMNGGRVIIYGH